MLGMMHKFLGGKKYLSFDDIAVSQKNSFHQLIDFITVTLDSLEDNPFINKELLKIRLNK
ncbi:hypothetical protein APF79_04400 [bacterium BRH_c32]|nr:MAG: hypothetical protein APF79_11945 [bacterium BRH_c32]KUO63171.1 MAG: hypothetical protein APF79_04400 [bacterium BRH_c32]